MPNSRTPWRLSAALLALVLTAWIAGPGLAQERPSAPNVGAPAPATTRPATTRPAPDDEFPGPFPSWKNFKRDYGAVGDGKADDTPALQKALDELTRHERSCVLFIPAGTYRVTKTLQTVRKAHTDCQGVALVGEDPATTTLVWDGDKDGTLLQWDAWYSSIARLGLDGRGRAGKLLVYGPAFSTYNQTTDMIFRDAAAGLTFGGPGTNGQAENEVLRCQFLRCQTGVQTINWNSMDIWVWYCRFEDCDRAVLNQMGNWHVWQSLFLRSRSADVSIQNLMVFSVVNNTSVGSKRFVDFGTGHVWGSPASITGNRVIDCTGDWAVVLGNAGPYLVMDNTFRLSGGGPARAVKMTWADQTLVGNTYTKPDAVEEKGRFRRVDEKVIPPGQIPTDLPVLPPTPPHVARQVFEVPVAAKGAAIQEAIDAAARLTGRRPVVHLPMGTYRIDKTLVIPPGCDVQLIGDSAGETGTRLEWAGPAGGLVLRLAGPSRATLRDFYIHAPNARSIIVDKADQPGGRIFADQLNTSGPSDAASQKPSRTAALRLGGLRQTDVLLRALQGSGNAGAWVEAVGAAGDGKSGGGNSGGSAPPATNQLSIFTGATGSAAGQYEVRRGARLVVRAVYHERSSDALTGLHLVDTGTLCIDATRFSYATSDKAATISADDFSGLFTLAASILLPVETKETCRFEFRGNCGKASVLCLNTEFWVHLPGATAEKIWLNKAAPPAHGGLIGCNVNSNDKDATPNGFASLANLGDAPLPEAKSTPGVGPNDISTVDDATLLRHLAPIRESRVWSPGVNPAPAPGVGVSPAPAPAPGVGVGPAGATDVRIHRVMTNGGRDAVVEFRAD